MQKYSHMGFLIESKWFFSVSSLSIVMHLSCCAEQEYDVDLSLTNLQGVWGGEIVTAANQSLWSKSVVDIDGGTGMLIAPRLILTAEHCGVEPNAFFRYYDQSGNLQVETIPMIGFEAAPIFPGFDGKVDIELFILQYPPTGVRPYWHPAPDRDNSVSDQILEVLGYGTGDGSWPAHTLRRGYECAVTQDVFYYDGTYQADHYTDWRIMWDCEEPETWTVGERGDSGAPIINEDGYQVAIHTNSPAPENMGPYISWTTNGTTPYIDWINTIVNKYTGVFIASAL